ncbi:MAG: hypothetical protein C0499_02345 [Zymomonas sp.]|nr:hypothetical protein [Zymomonas sp.]
MSAMTVEQVQAMVASGMTDAQIGGACGVSRTTVQGFRARHGIKAAGPVGKTRRGEFVEVAVGEFAPAAPSPKTKPITVAEFLLGKRKAICPVCQLREPVKAIVADARKKGERQADILECLQVCYRVTITPRDYSAHFSGRHDQ